MNRTPAQPLSMLPLAETFEPRDLETLIGVLQDRELESMPVYIIGGANSLDYGLPAKKPGVGLQMTGLNRVIDHPVGDMTVTVEAGLALDALNARLAEHGQCVPWDVPAPHSATIGGIVATNWNGARRHGYGTVRDYVIGIQAVDAAGNTFHGGGRVVKNVAGYDFCKLLTGSMGTLAVITQVTLKVRPTAPESTLVGTILTDDVTLEQTLESLVHLATKPVAVEVLRGPYWRNAEWLRSLWPDHHDDTLLLVGLEGTKLEVQYMSEHLREHWRAQGLARFASVSGADACHAWRGLTNMTSDDSGSLIVKATMVPSAVVGFTRVVSELGLDCSVQADAADGVVWIHFPTFPADGITRSVMGKLVPLADAAGGGVIIVRNRDQIEMTRQSVWGPIDIPVSLMEKVKAKFDPRGRLNPGRFVC
ncbi:MAG: FAD-binding oxidoreductase [Pirellulaceae bacterium]|nr:FAD-binding oxidoreductase [Planctomycetales bacterium]